MSDLGDSKEMQVSLTMRVSTDRCRETAPAKTKPQNPPREGGSAFCIQCLNSLVTMMPFLQDLQKVEGRGGRRANLLQPASERGDEFHMAP